MKTCAFFYSSQTTAIVRYWYTSHSETVVRVGHKLSIEFSFSSYIYGLFVFLVFFIEGFDRMSLLEWGDFYTLMAHSGFMAIAEWVSFETGVLLAGEILTLLELLTLFSLCYLILIFIPWVFKKWAYSNICLIWYQIFPNLDVYTHISLLKQI